MKIIFILFTLLFVGAFATIEIPVQNPPPEDEDGPTVYVPDKNDILYEVNINDVMEDDYPYFPIRSAVRFELYTRDNPNEPQLLSHCNESSLTNTSYDPNRPTRMFIHGWNSKGALTPFFTDAYFKKGSHNVNLIAVNWRDGADTVDYAGARHRVNRVGSYVAQFIDFLVDRGKLNLKELVLVGHSLGAHVSGIAGKNVVSGKIGKIVGLDPALPLFRYSAADARLASTDADYVETIHTNAGTLGFSDPLGHASFYPNGGSRQPGCGWDMFGYCAHLRSYSYYTESIFSSKKYLAVKCESLSELRHGRCCVTNEAVLAEMGGETSTSDALKRHGIFFFETNSQPIFSLGSQIMHGNKLGIVI